MPQTETTSRAAAAPRRRRTAEWFTVTIFLLPALVVIGALLIYPIFFTFVRSAFDSTGSVFVGLENYQRIFTEPRTLIALRNNVIWVVVAPAIVTSLGLVFAVLADRIPWRAAFKMSLFMPLVVSGLAAGVTFRFVYAVDPEVGMANALVSTVVHAVRPPGAFPNARPSQAEAFERSDLAWRAVKPTAPGEAISIGLVGIPPFQLPAAAQAASPPASAAADDIAGVVWLDFSPGGTAGIVDEGERGLPAIALELLDGGRPVAQTSSGPDGGFVFTGVADGSYHVQLAGSNFRQPFGGLPWLAPLLVTPSIIIGYIWIQTGFALIILGAGLAGINRDLQDSARVEGANEWQVFRFITVPLLRPILTVVFVTTVISVLKVFDLVLVIAPESVQYHANVLALEMWRASFGGARDFGLGSALAALLFVMIIPAMFFNLRRFRMEV